VPRLEWSAVGERFYEIGVDRGVLYTIDDRGVAWNGLVSVKEAPAGGEVKEFYVDGVKYLAFVSNEEYAATIEAYTYPEEFGVHDGTVAVKNGLFATQQARRSFGFSYRTKIGNDVNGLDHAYKIHLVYNALATPTAIDRNTMSGDTNDAGLFSWQITTKSPVITGFKPTAHFVIDSRETPVGLLVDIEDLLYGDGDNAPRLPRIEELVDMFTNYVPPPPVVDPPNGGAGDGGTPTDPVTMYDGGSPTVYSTNFFDGGSPTVFSPDIYDGGKP